MNYLILVFAIFFISFACITFYFISMTSLMVKKKSFNADKLPKSPLTIFLITNNYKPYAGGIVTALDSYAQHLRAMGHRVIIITLDFIGSEQPHENDVIRIWCPIKFKYFNNYMALPWRPTHKIYQLAKQFQPDIIHVFHPFLLGASGLKVGKKLHIPVIFTYMTLYDHYLHYIPLPKSISKPLTQFFIHNFCQKVDILIAPSNSAYEHIIDESLKDKTHILPLSILPEYLKETFTPKSYDTSKPFTLLFVSRFAPEKNIFFLLDVFKMLDPKKYKFVLIGFGSQQEALITYAYDTLKLSKQSVEFIISPPKSHIREWYDKADLFIFASKSETQGLVLAEAMARGMPVIALEAPGVRDIVKQGSNGFMVQDKKEMIEVIEKIAIDPKLFESLQKEAWKTGNMYSAHNCTHQLLEIYNSAFTQKKIV